MRRRRRAPTTQLARAGQRTLLVTADTPVREIRFRATTLGGTPSGRIEIATGDPLPRTAELRAENRIDATGMTSLSIIPEADTAITFLPPDRPGSTWLAVGGMVLVAGAVLLTAWEFFGG